MISPRWRKILGDLWGHKTRTILVVLSIAVGVFAVGMVAGSQVILSRDLSASYLAINPPSAIIGVDQFDDDLVQVVRQMPEVDEAEGGTSMSVRLNVGPDQWRNLDLSVFPDYANIRINKIFPQSGAWPPPLREMVVERSSLGLTNATIGDTVLIELPNGKQRQIRIAGTAHNVNMPPSAFTGRVSGFITFDTLEWLGGSRMYDQLSITVENKTLDQEGVKRIVNVVRDKIERGGRYVYFSYVPTPGKHPADDSVQPMLLILGVLGTLSLLLSGFLVVNIIGALLTQQVRQIGVMKSIGARTRQLIGMYLTTVLIFGIMALLVAVPLGALGAYAFSSYLAGLINFDIANFSVPPSVLALEIAAGLIVPLFAALWPIVGGTRITVREAIGGYGLGKGRFGHGLIDRLLERVHFLSRPLLLSLRNTFRRKGRLALTLITLTLGGAIFIGVFSVRDSLLLTMEDKVYSFWRHDVLVYFDRTYRIEQLELEALKVPGVVRIEPVGSASMRRLRPGGGESDNIQMIAPRATNDLMHPTMIEGRWIVPEDENAVVVSTDVLKNEPDIKVGDDLILKFGERKLSWKVVGIVQGGLTNPRVYANYPYFSNIIREADRAPWFLAVTDRHDDEYQTAVAKRLVEHFKSVGMRVGGTETIGDIRRMVGTQFDIIVVFLMIMAVLLAVVGGLGLMGTMSINVLERTREIGVMRAIGASDGAVVRIVIVEGVLIGLISWVVGAIMALPFSLLLSNAVGIAFIRSPLSYTFSIAGVLIWLAVVVVLAALASFLPAWNASRLTVRDVLAYDG